MALVALAGCGTSSGGGEPPPQAEHGSTTTTTPATQTSATPQRPGISDVVKGLNPGQLAGEQVVYSFHGISPPSSLLRRIRRGAASAVILFERNVATRDQVRHVTDVLQRTPRPAGLHAPLLVMVDQEGGQVRRLPGPPEESAKKLGSTGVAAVRRAGFQTGCSLASAGVNVDLAPVADVAQPGSAIGEEHRAFGTTPAAVARLSGAFAAGLRNAGVAPTAKHFPGFGAAASNTDYGAVTIAAPRRVLDADLMPFRTLIRSGVPLVMLSTATYPALGASPAAFSREVATNLLRRDLHYHGVVVTDDLHSEAVRRLTDPAGLAKWATSAGADLALFAKSYRDAGNAAGGLEQSISHSKTARSRAEASVRRILRLRQELATDSMRCTS
jgi:beta-N-acetylhexosaminidase